MLVVKDHAEQKDGVNICGCQHVQLADPEITCRIDLMSAQRPLRSVPDCP